MRRAILRFFLRFFLYSAFFLAATPLLLYLAVNHWVDLGTARSYLAEELSEFFDRPVLVDKLEWNLFPPSLNCRGIKILEDDQSAFAEIPFTRFSVQSFSYDKILTLNVKSRFGSPVLHLKVSGRRANVQSLYEEIKRRREGPRPKPSRVKLQFRKFEFTSGRIDASVRLGAWQAKHIELAVNGDCAYEPEAARLVFSSQGALKKDQPLGFYDLRGEAVKGVVSLEGGVKNFPIAELKSDLPYLAAVEGEADLRGKWSQSAGHASVWNLTAMTNHWTLPKQPGFMGRANLSLGTNQTPKLSLSGQEGACAAQLDLDINAPRRFMKFGLQSAYFDTKTVLAWWAALRPEGVSRSSASWTAEGTVKISSGVVGRLFVSDFNSGLSVAPDSWRFNGVATRACGGEVIGGLVFTPPSREFSFTGEGYGIQSPQLFSLTQSEPLLSGLMDIHLVIAGPLSSDFLPLGHGQAHFVNGRGNMKRFPVALKILSMVNVKTAIQKIKGEPEGDFEFKKIEGDLELISGSLYFKNLQLESDALDLSAKGSVNLLQKSLDVKVSAQSLSVLDEILQNIPLLNKVYTSKQKGLIPFWAGVKGSWSDPEVVAYQIPDPETGPR